MRRLTAPSTNDRGAVAVMVALSLVVLMVIAAWVIDGSALYQERRELQNSADAAALSIARDCVEETAGCSAIATPELQTLVNGNAGDGASRIPSGGITFPDASSVRVVVSTHDVGPNTDGDSTTVDYRFAPVIGRDGLEVTATAVARWGRVRTGSTIPIIASLCEFDRETADGFGSESVIYFHTSNSGSGGNGNGNGNGNGGGNGNGNGGGGSAGPDECGARAGQDTDGDGVLSGGFGWLDNESCVATISEDLWVAAKPGNGPPRDCNPSDLLDQTLLLPIYDDVTEPGGAGFNRQCQLGPGGKCYRIAGFAAFHVTGFRFPGNQSWRQNAPCSSPDTCLGGYFTEFLFPGEVGEPDDDGGFGARTIWLES